VEVPAQVDELADELFASGGVKAVVVGGSRASGEAYSDSDWDLGVYYRGEIDLAALATRGDVHQPGSWGRLMNGGAWLQLDGLRVDVLLRDLAVVEHWTAEARCGRYEVDGLLGYVAGIPTYSLLAEAAIARPLRGTLNLMTSFPDALATSAPPKWRFHRDFSLHHAEMHAARGNVVGAVGQAARAILEEAHARHCEQHRWALNEKRLLNRCELDSAAWLLRSPGNSDKQLSEFVTTLSATLGSSR
jgi:Nucleotidyltransferase domain